MFSVILNSGIASACPLHCIQSHLRQLLPWIRMIGFLLVFLRSTVRMACLFLWELELLYSLGLTWCSEDSLMTDQLGQMGHPRYCIDPVGGWQIFLVVWAEKRKHSWTNSSYPRALQWGESESKTRKEDERAILLDSSPASSWLTP